MEETLTQLIDDLTALRRNPQHKSNVARTLSKSIQMLLLVDYRRRADKAAEEIGELLEPATRKPDL